MVTVSPAVNIYVINFIKSRMFDFIIKKKSFVFDFFAINNFFDLSN